MNDHFWGDKAEEDCSDDPWNAYGFVSNFLLGDILTFNKSFSH